VTDDRWLDADGVAASRVLAARDLAWTGNHFLDRGLVQGVVTAVAARVDITRRGNSHAEHLRQVLAGRLHVPDRWIAVGAGSSQILDALLSYLPLAQVLEVIPSFHLVRASARRKGIPYQPLPIRDLRAIPGSLARAGAGPGTLLVLASPRNPQGDVLPAPILAELLNEHPGILLIDEAYVDFAEASVLPLLHSGARLVIVRTFSKAWGLADLRVGYAVSPLVTPDLDGHLLPYSVGALAEGVACHLLTHPDAVERSVDLTIAARERLAAALATLPDVVVLPSQANYVCLETATAATVASILRASGLRVAVLHDLPNYPRDWPNGLRIAVVPAPLDVELLSTLRRALAAPATPTTPVPYQETTPGTNAKED
jgi:histidinol-phosphate aminotransferase